MIASLKTLLIALCIWYLIQIQNSEIQAFINSSGKVNIMTLAYAKMLCFISWKINIEEQKIDSSLFEIYDITSASSLL